MGSVKFRNFPADKKVAFHAKQPDSIGAEFLKFNDCKDLWQATQAYQIQKYEAGWDSGEYVYPQKDIPMWGEAAKYN